MREVQLQALAAKLAHLPRSGRWWVAYSGGCDSHVLLHVMAGLREQLGFSLSAIYINHGLSPRAGEWGRHCQAQAAALGVDCAVLAVDARPQHGESPEAAARRARYTALAGLLSDRDILFTAHHQRDQAETLLLQLLRGAGPKGLAAMPIGGELMGVTVYRPLLDVAYDDLLAYAELHRLQWIEDESNLDTRFDRNYLRHQVMPVLAERWSALDRLLGRSAQHCAEASDILREVAADDLSMVQDESADRLSIAKLGLLSEARQHNLVRHWLQGLGYSLPSEVRLRQIFDEVMAAADDAEPCVAWPGVEIRRFRGNLYALAASTRQIPDDWCAEWDMASPIELPDGHVLQLTEYGSGLAVSRERLASRSLSVRYRRGGEQIRPAGRDGHRSLKKLAQDYAVAPWRRKTLPLLYAGDELMAVIGVCVAEGWQPQSGQDALHLQLNAVSRA